MDIQCAPCVDPYRTHSPPQTSSNDAGFSFADALDVINPLQHIPGINLIYRELTGDTIKTSATLAGGALFGGVPGFVGAMAAAVFEILTGDTPLGHVASLVNNNAPADQHALAAAQYQRTGNLFP